MTDCGDTEARKDMENMAKEQKAFETIGRAVMQLAGLDREAIRAIVQSAATSNQARIPSKPGSTKGFKLNRRPEGTVAELKEQIIAYLSEHGGSSTAGVMAFSFGVETKDLAFPLVKLRQAGLITKHGDRSLTTYQLTSKKRGKRASNGHVVQA